MLDEIENETRRLIYIKISSSPGISFTSLKRSLRLNKSTLRYHLDYLIKQKKINSRIENGQKCYYTKRIENVDVNPEMNLNTLTKSQCNILDLIQDNPGITKKGLERITRIKKKTLTYNLLKLMKRNLVWKVRSGRETGYEYKSKASVKKEVLKILFNKFFIGEIDEETFLALKDKLEKLK